MSNIVTMRKDSSVKFVIINPTSIPIFKDTRKNMKEKKILSQNV